MVTVVVRQRDRRGHQGGDPVRDGDGAVQRDEAEHQRRWELRSSGGATVEVALEGTDPPWLQATLDRSAELLQLRAGWNSYGARPVEPAAVAAALRLLTTVMAVDTPAPLLIPTSRGSVSLEWHRDGLDLEVNLDEPDRFDVYLDDHVSGREWEAVLTSDVSPLVEILAELGTRARSAAHPTD